uniref:NADH-ubiquinone oxidoreductase chain 2 n=1 Tax=Blattisocius tarsalis TaxID=1609195 RepID=A0A6B9WHJ5_9ACAR|nr:NADH dehydrogenase subunit 2 [Blattisocius tarsalis]QHQ98565.1 NADH dehydrogenase subunit 2 [Blattisocius tarsalis]
MKYSYIKLMILVLNINSIVLSLSSNSIFYIWLSMEINLLSYISMFPKLTFTATNSMMNYFIPQALSSNIFLLSMIMNTYYKSSPITPLFIFFSLWIKLGFFPFHNWYFSISNNMNWFMWFLLNTNQKIIPLWSLSLLLNISPILLTFVFMNTLYSSLEIFNQSSIRWLINSSSLNHMSWVVVSSPHSMNTWEIYMISYIILNLMLIKLIKNNNLSSISSTINNKPLNTNISILITMLNFMGLPPMMGFMPKMLTMISSKHIFINLSLLISSLIHCYMYMTLSSQMLITKHIKTKMLTFNNNNTNSNINLSIISSLITMTMFPMWITN